MYFFIIKAAKREEKLSVFVLHQNFFQFNYENETVFADNVMMQ